MLRWVPRVLIALVCLVTGVPAYAQTGASHRGKFDEAVREAVQAGQSVRAIVRFRSEEDRLRGSSLVTARGGAVRRAHNAVGALTIDVDAGTLDALAMDEGVASVSIDAVVRSSASHQTVAARSSGDKKVRESYDRRGRGVGVAIIDSGIQPHADLPSSRIRAFVDFVNLRSEPYDDFGHGTHVAGILAGSGIASAALENPYVGVVPDANIVALKVLDAHGAGRTSDVIAALEWVAANHRAYNIRVVNLSLGHPIYEPAASDPMVQAAQDLVRRGIVVVASAGNLGIDPADGQVAHGGITSPANGPLIIAVGAVDNKGTDVRSDDRVTDYSSRGPTRFDMIVKPDIVASGHRVVSMSSPDSFLFANYPALHVFAGSEPTPEYMILSGTSMAAPVVAGAAALVIETNPQLSANAVRAVLEFTAQDLPETNLMAEGSGYLNTFGAVRLAGLIKANAPLYSVWLQRGTIPTAGDELFGESVSWSKTIVWNQRVLLGDSAYIHFAAWGQNVVWGQSDNVVWGQNSNVVWGQCESANCDNVVWGQHDNLDNVVWGQCATADCHNVVWGQDADNVVWGQSDNVVWGQEADNVVWGQEADNVVWGQNGFVLAYWASNLYTGFWDASVDWTTVQRLTEADNVVWGQSNNVVWGQCTPDGCSNVVWGQDSDNVVWGQSNNVVWGQYDNVVWGQYLTVLTDGGV